MANDKDTGDSLASTMMKISKFLDPRKYASASPEMREEYFRNAVKVFFSEYSNDPSLLQTAIDQNEDPIAWLILKFSLDGRIQSKIAITIIKRYWIILDDLLSSPDKIMQILSEKKELKDIIETEKAKEWFYRRIPEMYNFLYDYAYAPPEQKIPEKYLVEKEEIIKRFINKA